MPELATLCAHQILCILGLLACGYGYYVAVSKAENEDFQAACDLSPKVSCSVVLMSESVCPYLFSVSMFHTSYYSLMVITMVTVFPFNTELDMEGQGAYYSDLVYFCRYSRGGAIIGPLLGDNHPLNFSNAVYGALLYLVLIVLGNVVC